MESLQIKQAKVLRETVEYYSANTERRCISGNGCFYSPESVGKVGVSDGCAVGRLLTKELAKEIDFKMGGVPSSVSQNSLFAMLPEDVQELGQNFLAKLQHIHDTNTNWNANGLSERGLKRVQELRENYDLTT